MGRVWRILIRPAYLLLGIILGVVLAVGGIALAGYSFYNTAKVGDVTGLISSDLLKDDPEGIKNMSFGEFGTFVKGKIDNPDTLSIDYIQRTLSVELLPDNASGIDLRGLKSLPLNQIADKAGETLMDSITMNTLYDWGIVMPDLPIIQGVYSYEELTPGGIEKHNVPNLSYVQATNSENKIIGAYVDFCLSIKNADGTYTSVSNRTIKSEFANPDGTPSVALYAKAGKIDDGTGDYVDHYVIATRRTVDHPLLLDEYALAPLYAQTDEGIVVATEFSLKEEYRSTVSEGDTFATTTLYASNLGLLDFKIDDAFGVLSNSLDLDNTTFTDMENDFALNLKQPDGTYHAIIEELKDEKVNDIGSKINEKVNNVPLNSVIDVNSNRLFNALQYMKNENGKYIDKDGNELEDQTDVSKRTPTAIKDIGAQYDYLKISEVVTIDANSPIFLKSIQNTMIKDLSSRVENLTLNEVIEIDGTNKLLDALQYERFTEGDNKGKYVGENGVAYNSKAEADAYGVKLKSTKVDDISVQINLIKMKDFIDIDGSNDILNAIKNSTIESIGEDIENLKVIDVLFSSVRYESDLVTPTGFWYYLFLTGPVDAPEIDMDIKVSSLGEQLNGTSTSPSLQERLMNATIGELESKGIVSLTGSTSNEFLAMTLQEVVDDMNVIMSGTP